MVWRSRGSAQRLAPHCLGMVDLHCSYRCCVEFRLHGVCPVSVRDGGRGLLSADHEILPFVASTTGAYEGARLSVGGGTLGCGLFSAARRGGAAIHVVALGLCTLRELGNHLDRTVCPLVSRRSAAASRSQRRRASFATRHRS